MLVLRILLLPFSFLYGLLMWIRNKCFDFGLFSSKSFDFPVIAVGNLTVGGTGKSPHVEYIVALLQSQYKLATLSRGYRRKTKGFQIADKFATANQIGDEPLQFHKKFKTLTVLVDEDRVHGVSACLAQFPEVEAIVLDDAFQHRSIIAGLNILLIDYSTIGEQQFMLPSGMLREWRRGRKRADIIVVSKSPEVFSPIEARRITAVLAPEPYQKVFYSYIKYLELKPFNEKAVELVEVEGLPSLAEFKVLLFSGIANNLGLKNHLGRVAKEVVSSEYSDHHHFSMADLVRIGNEFRQIIASKKIIITTEKDAMRLQEERLKLVLKEYPVFYLPIEVAFHGEKETFDEELLMYVRNNKRSN